MNPHKDFFHDGFIFCNGKYDIVPNEFEGYPSCFTNKGLLFDQYLIKLIQLDLIIKIQ